MPRGRRQKPPQNPFDRRSARYPAPQMRMPRNAPAQFMRANNQMIQTTTGVVIGAGALALGVGVLGTITGGFHP